MRVEILFHPTDADAAQPLAKKLRQAGHRIALLPLPLQPASTGSSSDWAFVLYSSNSASALDAFTPTARTLVAVVLDDAPRPTPVPAALVLDLRQGFTGEALEQLDRWLPAAPTPLQRMRQGLTGAWRGPQGLKRNRIVVIVAALAVVLPLLAWSLAGQVRPHPPAGLDQSPVAPSLAAPAGKPRSTALLAASDDQAALRRLLATLPPGGERDAARERLVELELHQLHQIAALPDALTRFAALTEVESDGLQPEPARIAAAQRVALQTELAQAELALAGADLLDPAAVDGIPGPATVQALRALQRRLGLPQSGALDTRTSSALAALLDAGGTLPAPAAALDHNLPAGPSIPRPGERFRDCAECPVLVVLPQGRASIGDVQGTGDPDERPVRELSLTYALAVGLTEVTALEWEACVRGGGCAALPLPGQSAQPGRPAAGISLSQARAYVGWLRSRTGLPYRLLSEAEWEFAARGGQTSAFGPAAGPEELCRFANGADAASPYPWRNPACADAYPDRPAPVGHLAPNGFGLHDTLGNLWEWVEDCWHPNYVGAPADMSAWKSGCTGTFGVLRGGAYSVDPQKLRVSYRFPHADAPLPFFGLRVARSL